jgi:hypothetical protein
MDNRKFFDQILTIFLIRIRSRRGSKIEKRKTFLNVEKFNRKIRIKNKFIYLNKQMNK